MHIRKRFTADNEGLSRLVAFSEEMLGKYKIGRREKNRSTLTIEEAADSLIRHHTGAGGERFIEVFIRSFIGSVTIELTAQGDEYAFEDNMASASVTVDDDVAADAQEAIQSIILRSFADDIKYRHKNGRNSIRMTVIRSRHAFLYQTLGAMAAAIVLGILFDAVMPDAVNLTLNTYLFAPIKTMYLNALKMVVAPVVFFSIITCIVQFSDLSALGRIGGKIVLMYLLTTVLAVGVGIGIYFLIRPGDASLAEGLIADASTITSQTMEVSIKDTIVGIVPTNIIDPFLKANMLQLIFMAVISGIATGLIGKYSVLLSDLFYACNDLFLKIVTLIIKLMPLAVFCSFMSMMLMMGISTVLSVLGMLGTYVIGLFCMMAVYCLLMVVLARLNPVPFLKKYAPVMVQVFSMSSSSAAIPINMEACEKKLGIDKKIFSLSIPLGATLNMDGSSIYLAVFALALAKTFGVEVSSGAMLSVVISIIVLSMGAPGIPGAGLICLSVLLTQIGVPVEAIGLVMGIDSLCDMFRTMNNTLGDVAVSTIVAKSEKSLDMKAYCS